MPELVARGRARDELRAAVFARFSAAVVTFEAAAVLEGLRARARSWGPLRLLYRLLAWWKVRPVLAAGAKVPLGGLEGALEGAVALQAEEQATRRLGDQWGACLGHLGRTDEPDWHAVEAAVAWVGAARTAALEAAGDDPAAAAPLRKRWADLVTEAPDGFRGEATQAVRLRGLSEAHGQLKRVVDALDGRLEVCEGDGLVADSDAPDVLGQLRAALGGMSGALPLLKGWCQWQAVRARAVVHGLEPLVLAYESEELGSEQVDGAFERGFYQWWTDTIISAQPLLSQFHSREHMRKIREFQQADDAHGRLALEVVRHRLSARLPPDTANVSKNSAMGILRRETRKQRRHMPVRALLGQAGDVVARLTPCFLMSPISVAQYLDPKMPKFDVVVFDEASQIPVWDAVGAIARGRSAVIVGDPKQLPPTNFFSRSDDEDTEGTNDLEDLESILDDCMGAQLPALRLRWHYRSRHESLIAFSNYHYYDNKLFTFPSPETADATGTGVSFLYVAGAVYDKGKSRTNRKEAEALVASLVKRLQTPSASHSVGIVTLNVQQRTLIEDLVDQARRQHPDIDQALSDDADEPVFIKNLENVQGDERDVIMFSIGYGPDLTGRVSMNFGPMNREGGHRRLNVAVTRARREVIVFSSLRADQIDLARTKARGVKDLKAYLDYAERGFRAIAEVTDHDPDADFGSPFEEQVYERLTALGWEIHKQVGCSGYRIDLAVVDRERPGRYLMGVECDGASYHSAATARDRDKLREAVLAGLGWKLHRIWSTDWWQDSATEIKRLQTVLEQAQLGADEESEVSEPVGLVPAAAVPMEAQPGVSWSGAGSEASAAQATTLGRPYVTASLGSPVDDATSFYASSSDDLIRDAITEIVRVEGPISVMLLSKRVGSHWALGRVTARAHRRIVELMAGMEIVQADDGGQFVWPAGARPDAYTEFRHSTWSEGQRDAEDLPLPEVANAAHEVLKRSVRLPAEDLARETARVFGFQRTGAKVSARMQAGIRRMLQRGGAVERDGDVVLVD